MRMFQSVSGHSSELSIANHSPQSTASQLKCVSDTGIKLIWESPTTENKNLHRHLRSFHSKLESNGLQVDRNHKFSEGIISTPVIFKATSKLFGAHRAAPITKTDFIFQHFLQDLQISQFNSAFTVSFHSMRSDARVRFDSGAIFLDQSRVFATHSNQ